MYENLDKLICGIVIPWDVTSLSALDRSNNVHDDIYSVAYLLVIFYII